MIRLCSVDFRKVNDDITINHNIRMPVLDDSGFTIVGIMLNDNKSIIANQLKEYNTYYYEGDKTKFESYIKEYDVRRIVIGINLSNIKTEKDVERFIKKLNEISKICKKRTTTIGIRNFEEKNFITAIVFEYREDIGIDNVTIEDLLNSVKIAMLKTKEEKYNYIYDKVCFSLDKKFENDNLCDFKDNKCIEKRKTNSICGCCRHYKNIFSKKLIKCKYLKNKRCTAKCISCKMFTCDTLRKKGIKFKPNDFYVIKFYFNNVQKLIIKYSFFTDKNVIMKRLLKLGK